MGRDEIIGGVIHLLRRHKDVGSVHQEPYKGDFFKFFTAAFNTGLIASPQPPVNLSADTLFSVIAERDPDVPDYKIFQIVRTFWEEWTYAWQPDQLHQKVGR
jgi:hypothetical protein